MKNEYREVIGNISVPKPLEHRVLEAAVRQAVPVRPKWGLGVVCAVLALVLVLGGVRTGKWKEFLRSFEPAVKVDPLAEMTVHAAVRGVNGGVYLPLGENTEAEKYDGTIQTLTIRFADGSKGGGTYRIEKEELRMVSNETGEIVPVPVLSGDEGEVTGLYAMPEDSCWLLWPVEGSNTVSLSNRYGYRVGASGQNGAFHAGIDIPAERDTAIRAAAAGTVTAAGFDPERGNYVVLEHDGGLETVYEHCQSFSVEPGDSVEAGEEIAAVGSTGNSTGPHLCFQVWQDGITRNPVAYFNSVVRDTLSMG